MGNTCLNRRIMSTTDHISEPSFQVKISLRSPHRILETCSKWTSRRSRISSFMVFRVRTSPRRTSQFWMPTKMWLRSHFCSKISIRTTNKSSTFWSKRKSRRRLRCASISAALILILFLVSVNLAQSSVWPINSSLIACKLLLIWITITWLLYQNTIRPSRSLKLVNLYSPRLLKSSRAGSLKSKQINESNVKIIF